jgi:hypothetical protein
MNATGLRRSILFEGDERLLFKCRSVGRVECVYGVRTFLFLGELRVYCLDYAIW